MTPATQPAASNIFVVEDDEEMCYLLEFMLKREGFSVTCARDGREAARLIAEIAPPQAVLLDLMLPYRSGHELVRQMRGHEQWRDVPIIVLTGRSGEEDVVRALDAGATDYVVKPFQFNELLARLRRFRKSP